MKALVSIIVPVYNVPERYLRTCIESLIKQTLREIEILLVDDGSTDKSGVICDEYAAIDSRIKVIHKENNGLSAARNTGFYASTGDWITFVDGDDWIEPDMCRVLFDATLQQDIELAFCGIMKEYEHSSIEYKLMYKDMKIYRGDECKELQAKLLLFNGNIACAYAKLIKRSFLVENNIIHDEVLKQGAEGIEFNLRLFDKLEGARFVNRPFYHYIFNEKSISASFDEKNNQFVLSCFEKIQRFIKASDNKHMLIPNFYNRLIYVILTTAISGYFSPENKDSYSSKVKKYKEYLNNSMIQDALKNANNNGLSTSRRITLFFIKIGWFLPVSIIAKVRRKQLKSK